MKSLIVDVNTIPVLPEVADAVIRMALDDEVSAVKFARLIEKDQALTSRILSMANSSFYKRARQVYTVREAVITIGADAVRSLALGLCILNVIPRKKGSALDSKEFWRHCMGSAMYAEAMMEKVSPQLGGKAFCAGLLHDIGKLVLDLADPEEYAAVLEKAKEGTRPLDEIEKEMLGLTHCDVGHDVLAHWKLPSLYEESIWCHHAPVQVIDDEQYKISGIINIANTLTHMSCIGSSGNYYPQRLTASLLSKFSLSTDQLDGLMATVPKQIDAICEEMGIGKPTEGLFSLVNRASMRLSEVSIKLQQQSIRSELATRRSDILLKLLKELNNTSKMSDALARASDTLFMSGIIRGFLGGFKYGEHNLVFEHREESTPRFIKVGDVEVQNMVRDGGYTAGMSLPWGVFVHMNLCDPEIGDDQEFISSLIGAVASSLRRIHAETALQQEKNLLRQALKAASKEKQKAEELVHLNRELMDSSTFGLCLVDEDNQVRIENAMSSELRELLGIQAKDLSKALEKVGTNGALLISEALAARAAKDVVWGLNGRSFRITTRPVMVNNWALIALWEITGELEEQKRTLAFAKMSVVGSLAASMAHNMKSPLGAIHGFASIIRDDMKHKRISVLRNDEEDQDLPDMLSNISTASENLLKIVNQLLNFTRKWESPEGEVGLEGFIEGIFQIIGAQANAAGVTLTRDVEPTLVYMKADAIEQVIINLLMNAINASSKGSRILLRALRRNGGLEFSVTDYGIGISSDQIRRIFEPLYTAWPLKTGMGLGLSLAREIIESLGGSIKVSSKLAEGSTFTVWIPEGKGN